MEKGMTYRFVVTGGSRSSVKQYLFGQLPLFSRFALRQATADGACRVDGEIVPASYRLRAGQVVDFTLAPEPQRTILAEELPLDILFVDEAILFLNKPAGMLGHPPARERHGTVANALLGHWRDENRRPTFPHRLDRDTSGVLVVAKHAAAAASLAQQFENRQVHKQYLALLAGQVTAPCTMDAPIGRCGGQTPPWQIRPEGRPSLSRLAPLREAGAATLVELEPVTGRTNQLRIHCASIGHPILGDRLYGGPPAARLCLHASRIEFHHPVLRHGMTIESPMADFNL
jgi:23S rRNA pseudouridine1911/1915/1917 synthase